MSGWMIIGLGLLGLGGADRTQEPPLSSPPEVRHWSTGGGLYIYHQLSADCESITHSHGRNAVWGLWRMPLAEILEDGVEEAPGGGALLKFRCPETSACIQSGAYRSTPGRTDVHAVPFETPDGARRFAAEVADLKVACGLGG